MVTDFGYFLSHCLTSYQEVGLVKNKDIYRNDLLLTYILVCKPEPPCESYSTELFFAPWFKNLQSRNVFVVNWAWQIEPTLHCSITGFQILWWCWTNSCWSPISSLFQINEIIEVPWQTQNTWVGPLSPVCLRSLFVYWWYNQLDMRYLPLPQERPVLVSAHAQNCCSWNL